MEGYTCAQIFRRQQRKRKKLLTFVELKLDILKEFARRFDPDEEKFVTILRHKSDTGMFDENAFEAEDEYGNIHDLGSELAYLWTKTDRLKDRVVRDQIRRWLWTIEQANRSDLVAFWLGWSTST